MVRVGSAIRTSEFEPEADRLFEDGEGKLTRKKSRIDERRGSFEGAIRIPLRAPSFLFNSLAFLRYTLFSIPTAPTHHFHSHADAYPTRDARAGIDLLVRH